MPDNRDFCVTDGAKIHKRNRLPVKANKDGILFPFHYNPRHSDADLDAVYKKCAVRKSPELIMSREGLSVTLKDGKMVRRKTVPQGFAK
jgi:hypothetical protein